MARKKFDLSTLPESPNLHFEQALWGSGMAHVAGIDEAGRGSLSGPVCAGAVVLPNVEGLLGALDGVRDSKQMTLKQREYWFVEIQAAALSYGVGFASAAEIDEVGIVPATRLAMMRAIAQLKPAPKHLLIDAVSLPGAGLPETSLIKGDARSLSIASASVLAKVSRDRVMVKMAEKYPGYGWKNNKGYGTKQHKAAIEALGATDVHRMSFRPMSQADHKINLG